MKIIFYNKKGQSQNVVNLDTFSLHDAESYAKLWLKEQGDFAEIFIDKEDRGTRITKTGERAFQTSNAKHDYAGF